VVAAYRKTGNGWQTPINTDLRKARKLKAGEQAYVRVPSPGGE
jgi:BrnA antitoxin of type II toxin-antitoxin system